MGYQIHSKRNGDGQLHYLERVGYATTPTQFLWTCDINRAHTFDAYQEAVKHRALRIEKHWYSGPMTIIDTDTNQEATAMNDSSTHEGNIIKFDYDMFISANMREEIGKIIGCGQDRMQVGKLSTFTEAAREQGHHEGAAEAQQKFASTVWEYDRGCNEGKAEFLDECGLKHLIPTETIEVTVEFVVPEGTDENFTRLVRRAIEDGYAVDSDLYVEFTVDNC